MKDGGPAFPLQTTVASGMGGTIDLTDRHRMMYGMSLRDWFAGMALQAQLDKYIQAYGENDAPLDMTKEYAASAYRYADAMLAERERSREG